jgi:hypothetical protein
LEHNQLLPLEVWRVIMQITANSNLVWKRESEEHQRWAKIFIRATTVLAVAFLAIGSYAYSTHVQYGELCETLKYSAQSQASPAARKGYDAIVRSHCSV